MLFSFLAAHFLQYITTLWVLFLFGMPAFAVIVSNHLVKIETRLNNLPRALLTEHKNDSLFQMIATLLVL